MRIAILTTEFLPFHGGIGTYARELAKATAALGHGVTVVAPDYGTADRSVGEKDAFAVRRFSAGLHSPRHYPVYARAAVQIANDRSFDRLFAVSVPFAEMLAATALLHGRRYDIAVHGSDINKERHSLRGHLFRPFGVFSKPERIVANSEFTRNLLLQKFSGLDPQRIAVAYPGVASEWFTPTDASTDIRKALGIDAHRRIVVTVARITPRKGQHVLLNALTRWSVARRERVALVLVGTSSGVSPDYEREIAAAAAAAKPVQLIRVERLSDPEIRALYQAADIFCLPGARHAIEVEGFGLVLLEAAAQGLPAVAGRIGGVPEIVRDGDTGLLVPPEDPAALAAALQVMLDDETFRNRLGQAAQSIAQCFTWDRCARQIFATN